MTRALVVSILFAIGCQDSVSTPFPPGLEPFSDSDVPGGLSDERVEVLRTSSSNDGMIRVYGRGFVLAPPDVLWRAAMMPDGMVARCNTTQRTFMLANEPEHELSFLVHYVVDDILTVEWDDQWRGDALALEGDASLFAMVKHQKIAGQRLHRPLARAAPRSARPTTRRSASCAFVEHLDAISGSADDVTGGMQDNYDALVELAHDRPIPPCR